jgi:hypothetical protein
VQLSGELAATVECTLMMDYWRVAALSIVGLLVLELSPAGGAVVGHWPLDDGLSDPTTRTVGDVSGNEHNGAISLLSQPWVAGDQAHQGGAIDFGPRSGYVQINVGDSLPMGSTPRTLAAWVMAREPADAKFLSYGSRQSGRAFDFTIELHDQTPHVFLRHWGGNMRYPNAVVGEFMHFAAVVPPGATNNSDIQVYLNGRLSQGFRGEGDDWRLSTGSSNLVIGARSDLVDPFGGIVDDVWLFDEALDEFNIRALMRGTYGILPGDFNKDGQLGSEDIDELTIKIFVGDDNWTYDLDGNGLVDLDDRTVWIKQLKRTIAGDSNLDGTFNSADLVLVFQAGKFEDQVDFNATWADGDWNGDLEFSTQDIVAAFQEGGYVAQAAWAPVVPEPSGLSLALSAALLARLLSRRRFPAGNKTGPAGYSA